MDDKKIIEQDVADAVMERPYGFAVDGHRFYLYPVTLGKMYLLQRQVENLNINKKNLEIDISMEALRLAKEKKSICVKIICYHTCKTKEEIFDTILLSLREKLFNSLSDEDIAALMIKVLTADKTSIFMSHLGIDKEKDKLATVMRIKRKSDKNNLSFGGKSVFGTFIDAACERYGWTKQYVVWGIDYASLRLMIEDKITSVYLSDEELKKLPASVKNKDMEIIRPTKENMQDIINMGWK